MIEVNTLKTNIPIPRSAVPDGVEIDNIGANILLSTATDNINKSEYLPVTVDEGVAYSNYIYVNTGSTFQNQPNNEPKLYYLILFKKDNPTEIFYSVPVRWAGRLNGTTKTGLHNGNNYLDVKNQSNIKYFEG